MAMHTMERRLHTSVEVRRVLDSRFLFGGELGDWCRSIMHMNRGNAAERPRPIPTHANAHACLIPNFADSKKKKRE